MKPTPIEITSSLLEFCECRNYGAPPEQMNALRRCKLSLERGDQKNALKHAADVIVGPIPWHESFDCELPKPMNEESVEYATCVFYGLLYQWKQTMNELNPPLCNYCQQQKFLGWCCSSMVHR